jgi:hypothetical protein
LYPKKVIVDPKKVFIKKQGALKLQNKIQGCYTKSVFFKMGKNIWGAKIEKKCRAQKMNKKNI